MHRPQNNNIRTPSRTKYTPDDYMDPLGFGVGTTAIGFVLDVACKWDLSRCTGLPWDCQKVGYCCFSHSVLVGGCTLLDPGLTNAAF